MENVVRCGNCREAIAQQSEDIMMHFSNNHITLTRDARVVVVNMDFGFKLHECLKPLAPIEYFIRWITNERKRYKGPLIIIKKE